MPYRVYEVKMEHFRRDDESFGLFFDRDQALRAAEYVEDNYRAPGCYVKQVNTDKECAPGGYAWVEEIPVFPSYDDWSRAENQKKMADV